MKTILHFHPNGNYAKNFVLPLVETEIKHGYFSKLVNEINPLKDAYKLKFTPNKFLIIFFPFIFFTLFNFFINQKPKIVFCHNSTSALFPLLVSRITFVRHIIYYNHGIPYVGYHGPIRLALYLLEKINCFLSTEIITVSFQMKKILETITNKKVTVIYNGSASGINLKNKYLKMDIIKIKNKIEFKPNDKIILFVGRPNKRKGFHAIIHLWNKLYISRNDFKLILLGINNENVLDILGSVPKNIYPMSYVSNSSSYFSIADYLFMCSLHEGLNYSILEAFNSNTVVLSNNIRGISELITNKMNGFLIKNNNVKTFDKYIKILETNTNYKNTIIKNGQKKVSKYSRSIFMDHYISYISKL